MTEDIVPREDELVNLIGDLRGMAQRAIDNKELALAHHLSSAADAALMRLAGADGELASAWADVYRGNVADRALVADELRRQAASRYFSREGQAMLAVAAEMIDGR